MLNEDSSSQVSSCETLLCSILDEQGQDFAQGTLMQRLLALTLQMGSKAFWHGLGWRPTFQPSTR